MTEECERRRDTLAEIHRTILELTAVATDEAKSLVGELFEDIADIELGSRWHDVGPDGVLLAAQRLLQGSAA